MSCTIESWTNLLHSIEQTITFTEYWLLVTWFVLCVMLGGASATRNVPWLMYANTGGVILNLAPAVLKACFSDMVQNQEEPAPLVSTADSTTMELEETKPPLPINETDISSDSLSTLDAGSHTSLCALDAGTQSTAGATSNSQPPPLSKWSQVLCCSPTVLAHALTL